MTGGIILGMIFLGEIPGVNDFVGVAVTLLGISLGPSLNAASGSERTYRQPQRTALKLLQ